MPVVRVLWQVVRESFERAAEDDVLLNAAALAFYGFLSVFPLLVGLVIIGSFFVEEQVLLEAADRTLAEGLPIGREIVTGTIESVYAGRGAGSLFSIALLLWSGTRIFGGLRKTFNNVWRAEATHGFVWRQLIRLGMLVLAAVGLVLVMLIGVVARQIEAGQVPVFNNPAIWYAVTTVVPVLIVVAVVAFLYKFVPACDISWRTVVPGAIVAALGFELAQRTFVYFVEHAADYQLVYGGLTGIVIILLWAYVSSAILLYGAEFGIAFARIVLGSEDATRAERRRAEQRATARRLHELQQRQDGEGPIEQTVDQVVDRLKPGRDEPYRPFHGDA